MSPPEITRDLICLCGCEGVVGTITDEFPEGETSPIAFAWISGHEPPPPEPIIEEPEDDGLGS